MNNGKLFDNCLIQAPDGVNLSRCGSKKLRWYLDRGMADLVGNDPPTIRLRFEPSGRRGLDDPLLLDGKPNVCVVCGTTENLTRHHIVPYCFIKHMDLEAKTDVIRDIFPLCRPCHDAYEFKSHEKKQAMADAAGMPLNGMTEDQKRLRWATGTANTLIKHGHKMPANRREELLDVVRDYLGRRDVSDADLIKLKETRYEETSTGVPFSKYAADRVTNYSEFAQDWRRHFVETMKPRYMPDKWKVDRITDNVWVPPRMLKHKKHK